MPNRSLDLFRSLLQDPYTTEAPLAQPLFQEFIPGGAQRTKQFDWLRNNWMKIFTPCCILIALGFTTPLAWVNVQHIHMLAPIISIFQGNLVSCLETIGIPRRFFGPNEDTGTIRWEKALLGKHTINSTEKVGWLAVVEPFHPLLSVNASFSVKMLGANLTLRGNDGGDVLAGERKCCLFISLGQALRRDPCKVRDYMRRQALLAQKAMERPPQVISEQEALLREVVHDLLAREHVVSFRSSIMCFMGTLIEKNLLVIKLTEDITDKTREWSILLLENCSSSEYAAIVTYGGHARGVNSDALSPIEWQRLLAFAEKEHRLERLERCPWQDLLRSARSRRELKLSSAELRNLWPCKLCGEKYICFNEDSD